MISIAMAADKMRQALEDKKAGVMTPEEFNKIVDDLRIQRLEAAAQNRRPKIKAVK